MTPIPPMDARSWTAATIDPPSHWYYPLPEECLAVFEEFRGAAHPPALLTVEARRVCAESLQAVRDALENGRGFAIVECPDSLRESAAQLYWIVGQALGSPVPQNVQGTLLYDVRDTGQNLDSGARFSVTNYESSFHTDNSFGDGIVDYVGLLCRTISRAGGQSQIVSGFTVKQEIVKRAPDLLKMLYNPFHVDRRGGVRAGESPTQFVPVFQGEGDNFVVRYLRTWIEAGHDKVGQPLQPGQIAALDLLDECLNRPEFRVEFDLKPGDMYFINNRWTLHNRTAFEDFPEPERRRHLIRLWLQCR